MDYNFAPYINALCNEIELRKRNEEKILDSIYIGGGTPNLLSPTYYEKIFDTVLKNYTLAENAEVTMEINPGMITKEFISCLSHFPINRISIGLQSSENDELKALGRIHDFAGFLKTYDAISKTDISNINVDIMTGIPYQSLPSLERTLRLITGLRPSHISCYALSLEENTPFYSMYQKGVHPLPDEEHEYLLYKLAIDYLTDREYERYEVSNFSKENMYSKHNIGYWDRKPYLGVGLNAASFLNHHRYKNTDNLNQYMKILLNDSPDLSMGFYSENRKLTQNEEISEFMFLGLRKTSGIKLSDFEENFKYPVDYYYENQLEYLINNDFIIKDEEYLKLTELGMDLSNQVLASFLLDE